MVIKRDQEKGVKNIQCWKVKFTETMMKTRRYKKATKFVDERHERSERRGEENVRMNIKRPEVVVIEEEEEEEEAEVAVRGAA